MEHFYSKVIQHRRIIFCLFLCLFCLSALCRNKVSVNYDMNDYLPEDSPSTLALDVMEEEFEGGIPNVRVMIHDLDLSEALDYKEQLANIDGVSSVTWLDDVTDLSQPEEFLDEDTVSAYYKDRTALYTLTIEEEKTLSAVSAIRELIGEENAMTGSAVSTAAATESTVSEIRKIAVAAVIFVFFVLTITTSSWLEPFIVLLGLGVAIVINAGSNLIFGEISFVTNAAGNILQLAVSLDYSIFLLHRFEEYRKTLPPEAAMKEALCRSTSSILSSGLTTVIGFLALVLMRFQIGPDLGLALAKGVAISLLTVFLFMPGLILGTHRWIEKTKHRSFLPDFTGFGNFVKKITIPLACLFAVLILPSYLASTHNEYYYGASHIFGEGTQLGDDTASIEEVFGKRDTYVLMVPKGDPGTELALSRSLQELPEVLSVTSYVDTFGVTTPVELFSGDTSTENKNADSSSALTDMVNLLESEHYRRMVISVDAEYEGKDTFALIEQIHSISGNYYPDEYYLAGNGVSTYDLMDTITADMVKVNLVAIGAVFIVLLLTMRSISLPVILVLTIETAIWINLSISYYSGQPLFYIAYLIISSVQLGATVDYAILFTDRYRENRRHMDKKTSVVTTITNVTASVMTSGLTLAVVGFLLGIVSTHGLLSQLGFLLGKGTLCSLFAVLLVLPGFLSMFDRFIIREEKDHSCSKKFFSQKQLPLT